MVLKLIDASEARPGVNLIVDGAPSTVRTNDMSKTGKHGHAKCRIEAIGIIDGKKRVFVASGHERFEVPMITKARGQILSITGDMASLMDLESFETLELPLSEELKEQVKEQDQVEYWDVEGAKIIKRKA